MRPGAAIALGMLVIWAGSSAASPVRATPSVTPKGQAAGQTLRQQLIGAWRLLSDEQQRPNGQIIQRRGSKPIGLLIYDASGHMSVQIMTTGFAALPFAPEKPTEQQVRGAFSGYNAYFGTYSVNEASRTVTHHRLGNLDPRAIGTDATRQVDMAGDRLVLTPPARLVNGESRVARLTWQRARSVNP